MEDDHLTTQALQAIDDVCSNTTVSPEVTYDRLLALRDAIELMLATLKEDMGLVDE